MLAVETRSLSRRFGAVDAVTEVTIQVEEGEVFGFLGPNGAGKTTTIRMLTTALPPSSGEARVLGMDVRTDGSRLRPKIGVVQQGESCEFSSTVEDAMDIYGMLWDVPRREREERARELLETFQLEAHREKRVNELSLGLRRRLQVAREFIHPMRLLFLDEPTVGLDPMARRGTLEMIKGRAREGMTVFLTTQNLDEAERLCDRVAVINHGRIVTADTPAGLKRRFGGLRAVKVSLESGDRGVLAARMREVAGVSGVEEEPTGEVVAWTSDPKRAFDEIIELEGQAGLRFATVTVREPSLEQAFINLIEREETGS